MKIVLLENTNSRKAGGLYSSVRNLGLQLYNTFNEDVTIVSCDDEYSERDKYVYANLPLSIYKVTRLPILSRFGYSPNLYSILEEIDPDIIDIQGSWLYYSYAAYKYKRRHPQTKIVITPRGMLDRMKKSEMSLPKKIAYSLFEKKNFAGADAFDALCPQEVEGFKEFGITCPIALIPNGYNIPERIEKIPHNGKRLLFISRIVPQKGVKQLIEAIHLLDQDEAMSFSEWEFRIGGWGPDNYMSELKNLVKVYNLENKVIFLGQVYGDNKDIELRSADAFILPSFSEGLPMAILEAISYRLPVIMTDGCNLPDIFEANGAIKVTTEPREIAAGIVKLTQMSLHDIDNMCNNGLEVVKEKYQWNIIAKNHVELYQWLLDRKSEPSFITRI